LAALFRYDVGFFLFGANVFGVLVLTVIYGKTGAYIRFFKLAFLYGLGTSIVFLPAAIYFLAVSDVSSFLNDIVDYSRKYYSEMRGLPFPRPWEAKAIAIYFPIVVAALAFVEIFRAKVRRSRDATAAFTTERLSVYLVMFACLTIFMYLKGVVRVSALHMVLATIPSLIVTSILLERWLAGPAILRLGGTLLALLALGSPASLAAGRQYTRLASDPGSTLIGRLAIGGGILKSRPFDNCKKPSRLPLAWLNSNYAKVVNYLDAYTRPDEKILVGLDRHDKIFSNPLGIYYGADRLPGTHWHQFDPGLQTRADIQTLMIQELKDNHVRWVVRDATQGPVEPNGSARSGNVKVLDTYLGENYRAVAQAGTVQIWLLKTQQPVAYRTAEGCTADPVK
jgi:hypothetical protein